MAIYQIGDFYISGDIFLENNYSVAEYQQYLKNFFDVPFNFEGIIKSLKFRLTINSNSRVCNAFAYNQNYDQIVSSKDGHLPPPVAILTLTLWRNGPPEIGIRAYSL